MVAAGSIHASAVRKLAGFSVSALGMGCYRVGAGQQVALERALQRGMNVLDTSSVYLAGASEACIGDILQSLPADATGATLRREELVLVTKLGYIQVVKFHPTAWHCIHPDFVRSEVERSTRRLGTAPDIVLLHNPEFFFSEAAAFGAAGDRQQRESEFYRRITDAFGALEDLVAEGKAQSYGVSTNPKGCRWSCTGQRNAEEATDIARMEAAAGDAAAARGHAQHHFRVLQMPLNLLELNAGTDTSHSNATAIQLARTLGIDVMVNRPLNAIPSPGFSTGDWSRSSTFIKLRDQRPFPPALALLRQVVSDALAPSDVPRPQPLSYVALQVAMSVPGVSVALNGARAEEYVDEAAGLLQEGVLGSEAVERATASVQSLLREMEAQAH